MRFKSKAWGWFLFFASCATAQDFNINNNAQNDISSTPSSYDVNNNYNPFTQDPLLNRYEPTSPQYNPQFDPNTGDYNPQYDPQSGQFDRFGGRGGGFGDTPNVPPWQQNNYGLGPGRNDLDPANSVIREA